LGGNKTKEPKQNSNNRLRLHIPMKNEP
jgi:hypothetical protein